MYKILFSFLILLPLFMAQSTVPGPDWCYVPRTYEAVNANFAFDRNLLFLYPSGTSPNQRVKWTIQSGYFIVTHDGVTVYSQQIGGPNDKFGTTVSPSTVFFGSYWKFPSAALLQTASSNGETIKCGILKTQDDGNVVIQFLVQKGSQYRIATDWQTGTSLTACTTLASLPAASTLTQGMCLSVDGRSELTSGDTRLVIQTDGNLVIYKGGKYVWDSKTVTNRLPVKACLQTDGNFVIYDSEPRYLWDSKTPTNPLCSVLKVESTGKVTLSSVSRSNPSQVQVVWST